MRGPLGATISSQTTLRCLLVGVTDAQAKVCERALLPIQMVRALETKEACAQMSTVLPLMVIAARAIGEDGLAEVRDLATTCAAEFVVIEDPIQQDIVARLHEALRRSDKRRMNTNRRTD